MLINKQDSVVSLRRQCELMGITRSSLYYDASEIRETENKRIMDVIDRIHTDRPYYGWPRITRELNKTEFIANHKRVYRLMKVMGIAAIQPYPFTSSPNKSHIVYPYLLGNVRAAYPNHIWGVDITYIRMKHEWLYLVAILDWYSRYIVSWELSDTLQADFCCSALQKALLLGAPHIHNSDQGSQFTSIEYVTLLKQDPAINISMDHTGRCFDNIFTERLWRTIKYEEVYLKEYDSPKEARQSLSAYITFYNEERMHSSLNYKNKKQ